MPRMKQTARKVEQDKPPQTEFLKKDKKKKKDAKKEKKSGTPGAGPNPSTSTGGNNGEMTLRQANLDSGDSQTWPDPDTLMPPQMVAQLEEQVTLPRHVLIKGMDTFVIKYFREHGMTPILMHTFETQQGWTDDMITHLIQNCNKAWGLSHVAPQELRYWDEINTDEESHPLSQGKKQGRDKEDDSEDSWDPDASIDTIAVGRKPAKKPQKDKCPSKQPYHGKEKGKKSYSEITSTTVTEQTMYITGDPSTRGAKLGAQFKTTPWRGQVTTKQPRNPVG